MSSTFIDQIAQLDAEDQYDTLYQEILDTIEEVSGVDQDLLEPTTPFMSIGLDSVMGVEIANKLGEKLALELQKTLIWTYSYMDALTKYLVNELVNKGIPTHS